MDKKTFSVRRAVALVLALVMVLSTMTVMVFAADKVSMNIKGLHSAQVNDVKLYTYENGEKGETDLLDGIETVADGWSKMYENIELTPGDYWVDGYDEKGGCNGGLAITVTAAAEQNFTVHRAFQIYATNSDWVENTDYTISLRITGADGAARIYELGKADNWGTMRTSCLFLDGDTVEAAFCPDKTLHPEYLDTTVIKTSADTTSNIEITGKIAATVTLTVNAPVGSTITCGSVTDYKYFIYNVYDCQTVAEGETGVTMNIPGQTSSDVHQFLRVQHPDGVTWWNFYEWSSMQETVTLTESDLYIGSSDFTKDTVYRFEKNRYDRADIYLAVNGDGYLDLDVGETFELNAFRNWQAIEDFYNKKIALPDMHYRVIDEAGNDSDVLTITQTSAFNSNQVNVTANKPGTAIVLVTYDAMRHLQGMTTAMKFGPMADKVRPFSAIWPECTGVFVVTVGADGTSIEKNMLIDRTEGKSTALDAEHDILFYLGDEGAEYSFTPEKGSTVTVDRSVVSDTMTFNGFTSEGVTTDSATGEVTVSGLTTGRHIIKVEKNGAANYQVVTARGVSYTLKNSSNQVIEPSAVKSGDALRLQFSNLVNPSEKLCGVYNFHASLHYVGADGTEFNSNPGGQFGVYDFSGNPARQLINITIPKYWIEDTYDLTGLIQMGGNAGVPSHRYVDYTNGTVMPDDAPSVGMNLSRLPALSLAVDSSDLLKVQLHFKDETGKTVAVSSDEITIQDGSKVKSMLTAENKFGAVAGDFTYAVSKAGYEAANGTLPVSESALDFTITLTRTADKIAAEAVEEKIAALGTVTKNSGEALEALREAYESLTDAQKELVGNLGTLESAERRYENLLKANNAGVAGKPSVREDAGEGEKDDISYTDVRSNDWFADSVYYVSELGLMSGTGSGKFSPNADTTRAMIVTILARLDGKNTSGTPWYAAGRAWAMENGVSDGTNMDGKITREQLCAMLYRYAQREDYDTTQGGMAIREYEDYNSISAYALDAMGWAVNAGLVQGRGGKLAPQAYATRAEIAVILDRFLTNIVK